MARTRTLVLLRAEVRQRADIEGDPHVTDAEVDRFINQSCAALHAICVDVNEGWFRAEQAFTSTPGTETIMLQTLIAGFYKLTNVEIQAQGLWAKLGRATDEERTRLRGYPGAPRGYQMRRAQDGKVALVLVPVPDAAYSITVGYISAFADLSADGDTFDGADGWEEWVVLDAAIKCMSKEESDTRTLQTERALVETRIKQQLAQPDLDHPPVVRDTARDGDWMDWPPRPYRGL